MKALYRKYRPCRLADVVGQPQVVDPLAAALKSGHFSHAYLFTGPRGCGKTSVARIFAHEVNNFPYELEDDYIDIIEIDAASNTGVDNIRELREKACVVPSEGKYKIYIIDEVHMLSKSAFNALLKTLEEPPEHVIFIMATTDPEKVPVTILSRAQVFRFKLVDADTMVAHLAKVAQAEKIPIDPAALAVIARRGGGSFRDSLSLLDQIATLSAEGAEITPAVVEQALGLPSDAAATGLLAAYRSADLPAATALLRDYYNTGGRAEVLAADLISRILAAPDPAFYALLEQLPAVRDPFADARLLLCFMPEVAKPAPLARNNAGDTVGGDPKNSLPKAKIFGEETVAGPASSLVAAEDAGAGRTRTDFSYDDFLDKVDAVSAKLRILLQQSKLHFDGSTLTIYPGNGVAKKTLAKPESQKILRDQLGGIPLAISDGSAPAPNPSPAEKDSAISKISAIMGNIQEVNIDGGSSPF